MTCDRLDREHMIGHLGEQMDPHVEQCPDCRTRRDQYAHVAAMLARESDRPLPDRWKERTLARLESEIRRPRRVTRTTIGLSLAAAAALIILIVALRDKETQSPRTDLVVRIEGKGSWRGSAHEAKPGDILHVTSPGLADYYELRLYRESREVVASCPGDGEPTCRQKDGGIELTWMLRPAGEYRVMWLTSTSPLPRPTNDLDADLLAADQARATVRLGDPIHVY